MSDRQKNRIIETLKEYGPLPTGELRQWSALRSDQFDEAFKALQTEGKIRENDEQKWVIAES